MQMGGHFALMLHCGLAITCLLLAFGCARADRSAWRLDHIITTYWLPPPLTDEAMAAVASEGYTLAWTTEAGLDICARHGLRAMLHDGLLNPASLDDPEQKRKLDALIDRVRSHPALYAYFLKDEPRAAEFEAWARLVAYLRERDPAHLGYINLYPSFAGSRRLGTEGDDATAYREYLRRFVEIVKPDLISYDHYPFFHHGDPQQYFLNLELVRQASLDAGVPFLNTIQAHSIVKKNRAWRPVTASELRWMVYTTLAYGGRGISYFVCWGTAQIGGLYQDGKQTPLASAAAELNREVAALSPELMAADSLGVYHTAPLPWGTQATPADAPVQVVNEGEFVVGLFGTGGRVDRFLIVNRDCARAGAARIRLPAGTRGLQEFSRSRKSWQGYADTPADYEVTVELQPGDGRLFRLVQ